ncbi:hypothetical protein BDN71DRAFT_1451293 [Pleurotus eryngii]|uniref:Uncharacterized protein n=1 Tax=Pleurotus eryngii TaxID=5323 RepID=A0A9P5ZTU2_PLEER|nr:hypothetical protein BDN71DRAFT_1451293 [Pleurotus eryngii]
MGDSHLFDDARRAKQNLMIVEYRDDASFENLFHSQYLQRPRGSKLGRCGPGYRTARKPAQLLNHACSIPRTTMFVHHDVEIRHHYQSRRFSRHCAKYHTLQ